LKTIFPKWERWSFTVQKYPFLSTDVSTVTGGQ